MQNKTLLASLVAVLCLSSFFGGSTTSSSANSLSTDPVVSPGSPPAFTVCQGTFALCTSAKCTPTDRRNRKGLIADCLCDVRTQEYSAGKRPCSDVPQGPPQPGQVIPSRYSPVKSMAVCTSPFPWAMCLDSHCTVNKDDPSKATCKCKLTASPGLGFVVVTDSFRVGICSESLVSSATVDDVVQVTGFLQNNPNLKPFPITILGVDASSNVSSGRTAKSN